MATRAVSVVIERAPGGGRGINMRVGAKHRFAIPCSDFRALCWIREQLEEQGADQVERGRAIRLLTREFDRKARAEVVAEVAS